MLLNQRTLDGIRDGRITLAFRRWQRPTVRAGGTLLTGGGQLTIDDVAEVDEAGITERDARRAGYPSRDALMAELRSRPGRLYRIAFGALHADPRVALRDAVPEAGELDAIVTRLKRMDIAAESPWTARVLRLLERNDGVRAGDLCVQVGLEKDEFKIRVRRLKALGLTESLGTGYRIAPRGAAVLKRVGRQS
jgi:hypothetical protein